MKLDTIRTSFTKFFARHDHRIVPSSSLIPANDPSILLTTAGMQQFKPVLLGQADPRSIFGSRRLASVQRCFRTSDIDAVGDGSHLTFFEMLGNFSIGDYSKEEAIRLAWECLTKTFRLPKGKLWATIFAGDDRSVKDIETYRLWQAFLPLHRMSEFGRSENWWGPPGTSGPCGPSTELHYDLRGQPCERGDLCRPNCACGRFLELWNLVFMEFFQDEQGRLSPLPQRNVDTGMGLERLALVLNGVGSVFDTDAFRTIISAINKVGGLSENEPEAERQRRSRIIADHLRGAVFLVADGVRFSNKDRGYILRRIFRRALDQLSHPIATYPEIVRAVIRTYCRAYPSLHEQRSIIEAVLQEEAEGYDRRLTEVLRHVLVDRQSSTEAGRPTRSLTPSEVFTLYATHGLSLERIRREGITFDLAAVQQKIEEHRVTSRAGRTGKFGGHGLGYSLNTSGYAEMDVARVTRLHTATHLLHQALRTVLGAHVQQSGSDISPDRLRFDFTHPAKCTSEELRRVTDLVQQQIDRKLSVTVAEVPLDQALRSGALSFFRERYPEQVKVYTIGDFSKEICGGPHVRNTAEVGRFRILSEKSTGAGIRRIKATVEP